MTAVVAACGDPCLDDGFRQGPDCEASTSTGGSTSPTTASSVGPTTGESTASEPTGKTSTETSTGGMSDGETTEGGTTEGSSAGSTTRGDAAEASSSGSTGPEAACDDEMHNGDETDVDCGGDCPPCSDGSMCARPEDCSSGVCTAGVCVPPTCGDGVVHDGEACDDAGESAACNVDCSVSSCGDGVLNATAGEACDDGGESATCDTDCSAASCGDGLINSTAGEACDDGAETATCDADCSAASCGDGLVNAAASEACDDGGESATCNADCSVASCGDGVVNGAAGEECDDAGPSATCTAACMIDICANTDPPIPGTVLAIQDFENVPATPVWAYMGTPFEFVSGSTTAMQRPPLSPIGIGCSQAWHHVGAASALEFDTITIPPGFDEVTMRFRLAAGSLSSSAGGPDGSDYVLVELSVDGGPYYARVRMRGAAMTPNATWNYAATGVASVPHLPMSEEVFQPLNGDIVPDPNGFSTVEIVFPGTVTNLGVRITPFSTTGSDSWLIDDLVLYGEAP